jgi:hypothetical protein
MSAPRQLPTFRGRNLGIAVLVAAQLLIGAIHIFFGAWLLSALSMTPFASVLGTQTGPDIYSLYTILFGVLTLVFAALIWQQKRSGWIGTVAVAIFVIVADSLTLLNLPSVPGIPKVAGAGEISYSLIALAYLLQGHVLAKYRIGN